MPKNDPQGDQIYWMEAEFNGWWDYAGTGRVLLSDLRTAVCKYYKVKPIPIVISHKSSDCSGEYDDESDIITLYRNKKGDNPGVLMHELAHYVTDCVYDNTEHHGPEFMAIYMHLLDKYCFLPNEEFRRLAKKYKLKIGRRYRPIAFA